MVKYELNHVKLTDTQFELIIGDIVDSDPLTDFDADPDPRYSPALSGTVFWDLLFLLQK
jgi:hypothetical protein